MGLNRKDLISLLYAKIVYRFKRMSNYFVLTSVYLTNMITLILILLIGSVFVYLAQNNLTPVTLHLGSVVVSDLPLFYVISGSLLTGLILAYLFYLINSIFIGFSMRKKDHAIKETKNQIAELTKQIHKLEIENEGLRSASGIDDRSDKHAM